MEAKLSAQRLAKFPNVVFLECNPDDTEVANGFRERVCTFSNNRGWSSQQAWLFPTICAQYGWKCVSSQILQCETCHSTISPAALNRNNFDLYQKCIKNTLEKIKTSHKKHCPWPITPSPDHYVRMYPMHKGEAYSWFVKRLKSLCVLQDQLPCVKDGVMEKLGLTTDICSSLCKIAFHIEEDFSQSAILLAVTGWSKDKDSQPKTKLQCSSCQRSVPLFMYATIASSKLQALIAVTSRPEDDEASSSQAQSPKNPDNSIESKDVCDSACTLNENKSQEACDIDVPHDQIHASSEKSCDGNMKMRTGAASENSSLDSELQSPSVKRKRLEVGTEYFDPLYEHRPWCPFLIDSGSYNSSKDPSTPAVSVPGWQLFLKCLLRNARLVDGSELPNTPLKDQVRYARDMLESWNSPD